MCRSSPKTSAILPPRWSRCASGSSLPGMRVLQFAFGGDAKNDFLPHNYTRNTVVYTGTHDNDTTRGWFDALTKAQRNHALNYLNSNEQDIVWDMIRAAERRWPTSRYCHCRIRWSLAARRA